MWGILSERKVSGKVVQIIQKVYMSNVNCIPSNSKMSKTFTIKRGLKTR